MLWSSGITCTVALLEEHAPNWEEVKKVIGLRSSALCAEWEVITVSVINKQHKSALFYNTKVIGTSLTGN